MSVNAKSILVVHPSSEEQQPPVVLQRWGTTGGQRGEREPHPGPSRLVRILFVHPDPHARAALAHALPEFAVAGAADRPTAMAALAEVRPQVVVSEHVSARRLLKELDRTGSEALPIFLCPLADSAAVSELADVAAEGHVFHTLDGSLPWPDMASSLRRLLHPRDSARMPLDEPLAARFVADGQEYHAACIDLGNQGLALRFPADEAVERLSGVTLRDLRVFDAEGGVLLAHPHGTVRQLSLDSSQDEPSFRMGVVLTASVASENPGLVLKDPVRVLALLRRAGRRGAQLSLSSPQGARWGAEIVTLPVTPETHGLSLRVSDGSGLQPGEVLELSLELGGEAFRGHTCVLARQEAAVTVAVPRSLTQVHRRNFLRFRPPESAPFVVSFRSPLDGSLVVRSVLDIHVAGLSFAFDAGREVLPVGLRIGSVSVTLPSGAVVHCGAEVRSVRALPADPSGASLRLQPYRCGLRLIDVPLRMRAAIAETSIHVRFPTVRSGQALPFHEVWSLMRDSGQYFPEYPFEPGPHIAVLERAQERLARSGGQLGQSFTAVEGGRACGYISGLRMYSRTWMCQHLAVLPGYHRHESLSRDMSTIALECAESLPDIEYLRYVWRAENRWAHRVFGWIARAMRGHALTRLQYVNYLALDADRALESSARFPVRDGTPADAQWLERHMRSTGRLLELRSDDLTASELSLQRLGAQYAEWGLRRSRRALVVDGESGPLALALLEQSTPGLCWPEITNAFKVFVPNPDSPRSREAVRALAVRAAALYREAGRSTVIGLMPDAHAADLVALGFQPQARVAEWTFHRSLVRTWYNAFLSVFERLSRRATRASLSVEEAR